MREIIIFTTLLCLTALVGSGILFAGLWLGGAFINNDFLGASKYFYPEGSTVATSGQMVIGSNVRVLSTSTTFRTSAQICNTDDADVYISFRADAVPTTGAYDYEIAGGECFQIDRTNGLYQGSVRASSTDAEAILTINEFVI